MNDIFKDLELVSALSQGPTFTVDAIIIIENCGKVERIYVMSKICLFI